MTKKIKSIQHFIENIKDRGFTVPYVPNEETVEIRFIEGPYQVRATVFYEKELVMCRPATREDPEEVTYLYHPYPVDPADINFFVNNREEILPFEYYGEIEENINIHFKPQIL